MTHLDPKLDRQALEDRLIGGRVRYEISRSSDGEPLAFGRDLEAIRQLARRIQPITGEWRAVVRERRR